MEFFCLHRDRSGATRLRERLREQHWSYLDRFEQQLIARGPTLDDTGETPTGSVHIVRTTDSAAARAFAFDEPYHQAGVFRDVLLRRWHNVLGRTMWEFPLGYSENHRYLVIGLGSGTAVDLEPAPDPLIAFGHLLSDDGATWLGTVALVQAPGPAAARTVLAGGSYASIEVQRWDYGGRPG